MGSLVLVCSPKTSVVILELRSLLDSTDLQTTDQEENSSLHLLPLVPLENVYKRWVQPEFAAAGLWCGVCPLGWRQPRRWGQAAGVGRSQRSYTGELHIYPGEANTKSSFWELVSRIDDVCLAWVSNVFKSLTKMACKSLEEGEQNHKRPQHLFSSFKNSVTNSHFCSTKNTNTCSAINWQQFRSLSFQKPQDMEFETMNLLVSSVVLHVV